MSESTRAETTSWWHDAVIYQLYPASFADGDGDGIGDLTGVRARLSHLVDLGVDAVWFTPWYLSPLADGGYDVADYRAVDPAFGSLDQAEALIAEAREAGLRVIVDIVPNHCSIEHEWFRRALAEGPGSPWRRRFWFVDGEQPPTDWVSDFDGGTWTRTVEADGTPGQWYLHLFAPQQPDWNWNHPEVIAEHEAVLRFWFDRGVAGFRVDSAALPAKDPALPSYSGQPPGPRHPYLDRDEVHEIYRGWRRIADSYAEPRLLVGEVWLADRRRFADYLRGDEFHTAFNFDFMSRPWRAADLRESIQATLDSHREVAAPPTWVLSNHDVTRTVTRFGRAESGFSFAAKAFDVPTDPVLGTRRARAAALLSAALPGSLYVYQGEELGLPEVEDLPAEARRDPMHFRSGGRDPGRDGCRVPLPWTRRGPSFGFGSTPGWLPQPADWGELSVAAQAADPDSMLRLYRSMLAIRRTEPGLRGADFAWLDTDPGVLGFRRGSDFACLVNFGPETVDLPAHTSILAASGAMSGDRLRPDTAVWLRIPTPSIEEKP